jgi:hypothetical protein
MSRRNRGQFGTAWRAVTDHYKTLLKAAVILDAEHGQKHKPGERLDLCPKCQEEARTLAEGTFHENLK